MGEAVLQRVVTGVPRLALVLVDPVCGTDVQAAILNHLLPQPVTMAFDGTHYLFCSDLCRREFEHNPRRYSRPS